MTGRMTYRFNPLLTAMNWRNYPGRIRPKPIHTFPNGRKAKTEAPKGPTRRYDHEGDLYLGRDQIDFGMIRFEFMK